MHIHSMAIIWTFASGWLLDQMTWVQLSLTLTRMVLSKNHMSWLFNCFKGNSMANPLISDGSHCTHHFRFNPSHRLPSPQFFDQGYRSTTCMRSRQRVWRHSCCQCCSYCRKTGPSGTTWSWRDDLWWFHPESNWWFRVSGFMCETFVGGLNHHGAYFEARKMGSSRLWLQKTTESTYIYRQVDSAEQERG